MRPAVDVRGLKKARPWEYAIRFGFGGIVTAATGVVAHRYGPTIGGLFLAFPAILPASLTLVHQHDGRPQATDDARGACLGAVGLAVFALAVWRAPPWPAPVVLGLATVAWLATSVLMWFAWYGWRPEPGTAATGPRRERRAAESRHTARIGR